MVQEPQENKILFENEAEGALTVEPVEVSRAPSAQAVPEFPVDPAPLSKFVFPLRDNNLNPLIDASSSLLALILRLASLRNHSELVDLHKQIRNEIESIELEINKYGYDRVTTLAHRYCLCSVVDEFVMNTEWGQESEWSERSLLALFHNETWGGEKFFVVLDRLLSEPQRYLHLIEFQYLCLTLGFEGKFRVRHNGRAEVEEIMAEVYAVIRRERGEAEEELVKTKQFLEEKAHYIRKQTPVSVVWIVALVCALFIYLYFYLRTNSHTSQVISQLQTIIGG